MAPITERRAFRESPLSIGLRESDPDGPRQWERRERTLETQQQARYSDGRWLGGVHADHAYRCNLCLSGGAHFSKEN
jgi:hypothetical protein